MQFSGDLISHGHSRYRANTGFTIHTNIRLLCIVTVLQIKDRCKSEFSNFRCPVLLIQESLANARIARNSRVCMKTCLLPSQRCLTPPSWGTPCDINAIYTSLKSTFSGLQFRRWQYGSIFICLAVVASERRNSKGIWPYSSSRSSKVIDLGVNWNPICDFLLVTKCNISRSCYRFRDI